MASSLGKVAPKVHLFKNSSNLTSTKFLPDNSARGTLEVTFHNGAVYRHFGVPREAYDNFLRYRSPGEFYHQVIRRYKYEKVTASVPQK